MGIEMGIWRAEGAKLTRLAPSAIDDEEFLETLLESDPSLFGVRLLIIGRQVETKGHGTVDLLAIDASGAIWVIELKRNRTAREVTSQIIGYGSWVETLERAEFISIFARYRCGDSLQDAFYELFEKALPDEVNNAHVLTIVAASVDKITERFVRYLERHGVPVNIVLFQHFNDGGVNLLTRAWHSKKILRAVTTAKTEPRESSRQAETAPREDQARSRAPRDRLDEAPPSRLGETRNALGSDAFAPPTTDSVGSRSTPVRRHHYESGVREAHSQVEEFWDAYAHQFEWNFLPTSFLDALYESWLSEGLTSNTHRERLTMETFRQRLRVVAIESGDWEYTQASAPYHMSAFEPLTALLPDWKRDEDKAPTWGYRRTRAMRKSSGPRRRPVGVA